MKVDINVITNAISKKLDSSKQVSKKDEFKKVLDSHEMIAKSSSNENVDEKHSNDKSLDKVISGDFEKVNDKNQSDDVKEIVVDASLENNLVNVEDNLKLKSEIISFIEVAIGFIVQSTDEPSKESVDMDKTTDEMSQMQQLLQSLIGLRQDLYDSSITKNKDSELSSVDLEKLTADINSLLKNNFSEIVVPGQKLVTDTKGMLKNNFSEIVVPEQKITTDAKGMLKNSLNEIVTLLETHNGDNDISSQILNVLKKFVTEVEQVKGDSNLFKVPILQTLSVSTQEKPTKDNPLQKATEQSYKTISEILPKNQMQSQGDSSKESKFSRNSSSEEKFLNNLISEDKEEPKISKAVNFMNQFEAIKTLDTTKVQTPNLVIDKNNLGPDVIKTIKFMEINNVKDLTVKMNPKELGEITIKIVVESGVMKASISAQNKETYNLLNQNIQDISDKLKSMDIKIQSLDINIYEDSTFFSKDSNEKNNQGQQNRNTGTNVGLEEEDVSLGNNYIIEESQVNKFV